MAHRLFPLLLLTGLALAGWSPGAGPAPEPEAAQTVHVPRGDTAADLIVSLANPVRIDGRAARGVFCAGSELTITGEVVGDVAVIGGQLTVGDGAVIRGDVILIGGTPVISPGARIEGRLLSAPLLGDELRSMLTDPAGFLLRTDFRPAAIATRLSASLLLFLLCAVLMNLWPAHIAYASTRLKRDPWLVAGVGVVGTTAFAAALMVALALCLVLVGIPLVLGLVVFGVAATFFGLATVFYLGGELTLRLLRIRARSPLPYLAAGITVWTILKFIPLLSLITHVGVLTLAMGICLATRFGTGRPWLRRPPAA